MQRLNLSLGEITSLLHKYSIAKLLKVLQKYGMGMIWELAGEASIFKRKMYAKF